MKKIIFSCVFSSIVLLCIFLFLEFSFLKKHNQENLFSFVFLNYNLSRFFMCLLCGFLLAFSSLILRIVMQNPLASDTTLGVAPSASFAILIATLFFPSFLNISKVLMGFAGAFSVLFLIFIFMLKRRLNSTSIILLGLISGMIFGALSSLLMLFYPEESKAFLLFNSGYFTQNGFKDVVEFFCYAGVALVSLYFFIPYFKILNLGDELASSVGQNIFYVKFFALCLSAYFITLVVSFVGVISFLGLFASVFVEFFKIKNIRKEFIICGFLGFFLLFVVDLLLQILQILKGVNLPTGGVLALIGSPLLIFAVFRMLKETFNDDIYISCCFKEKYVIVGLILLVLMLFFLNLYFDFSTLNFKNMPDEILALRLNKLAILLLCGILLALVGFILQKLSFNPMASPEMLGINSGASLGVLFALYFSLEYIQIFAIIGALLVLCFLFFLSVQFNINMQKIILIGIAIMFFVDALGKIFLASGDFKAYVFLAYTQAGLINIDENLSLSLLIYTGIFLFILYILYPSLKIFSLGENCALSVGLNITKVRIIFLSLSAFACALSALCIGPFSFVGLLAAHIVRLLGIKKLYNQLLSTALLGICLMFLAYFISKIALFPYEIPLGIVATLLGSICLFFMIKRY
ncbi:TPA: iron ABC transporter permease [Campylobacter jejuni]|nr:iron ABC transporter permease [Campylobacter jejuni]HDZ4940425.1 iron ABC transporter permease [Campylobacter jejuni]HDZ4945232.1 iron ABC transporter permease [Campylobacter jejuni]HDZ4951252.1 iron ABC transporter permease [Campylobacter jejuni]HDZ4993189.1 iron ABC transporter permease [Campylobacter jejuni]